MRPATAAVALLRWMTEIGQLQDREQPRFTEDESRCSIGTLLMVLTLNNPPAAIVLNPQVQGGSGPLIVSIWHKGLLLVWQYSFQHF